MAYILNYELEKLGAIIRCETDDPNYRVKEHILEPTAYLILTIPNIAVYGIILLNGSKYCSLTELRPINETDTNNNLIYIEDDTTPEPVPESNSCIIL